MKFSLTLLIVAFFAINLTSQDIINKYGAGGKFVINNSNDITEFEFRESLFNDAELIIGKNTIDVGTHDVWMLNLQSSSIGPFVTIAGLENSAGGSQLWFQKARNNSGTILPPLTGDNVGHIVFSGYQGTQFHPVSSITSNIIAPGTSQPAADLKFWTSEIDAGTSVRMTIKDNGIVNIANLDNDAEGYVKVDADGNLIYSADPPNSPEINNELDHLKMENKLLKERLVKLETLVEELATQK